VLWLAVALFACAAVVGVLVTDRLRRRRDEAQAYLKGVRSMLSGDPDAAIEALSDAARLGSPGAIETYLALGALFRRTGDLARAVRLHRNMLLGPDLTPGRRAEVERELAEDYRRSGMLAEAAEIHARHAADGVAGASEALRDVLLEQGDLAGAAAVQRRVSRDGPDALLAHLEAALAREVLLADSGRACQAARRGVAADPASADALLALAEAEAAAGRPAVALESVTSALDCDGRAAMLAWPALASVPVGEAIRFVEERLSAEFADASLHLLHGRALQRAGRMAEALAALRRGLERDRTGEVTLAMREVLRDAAAPGPEDLAARHDLLVASLVRRAKPLRCVRCGVESGGRVWRCRRCGAFDAFP
jgi:lipopolysaccharide biosynthesis regulator YciM